MKYSITSTTGYPFRRDGISFHPQIPTIMDEKEITEGMKATPALKIVGIKEKKRK